MARVASPGYADSIRIFSSVQLRFFSTPIFGSELIMRDTVKLYRVSLNKQNTPLVHDKSLAPEKESEGQEMAAPDWPATEAPAAAIEASELDFAASPRASSWAAPWRPPDMKKKNINCRRP